MTVDSDLFVRTSAWMQGLAVPGHPFGRFKMSYSSDDTIFTSCFAAFVYELIGDMDRLEPARKQEWLDYILSYQDESTGLFTDPEIVSRNLHSGHDTRYVTWQLSTFCISAVRALGGNLRFPLRFLVDEGLRTPDGVRKMLESFNWHSSWGSGNLAMFLGIFLICDAEHRGQALDEEPGVKAFFDWHDNYQNPRTGFWGEGRLAEYHNGLFGAYHQYLLYFYANRDLGCKQTIIDKILSFQNIDGMFAPQMGGGGCEDVDAVDTLVQLFLRTGHRDPDVKKCLRHVYDAVCSLEAPEGGFIWGVRKRYGPGMYVRNLFSFWRQPDLYQWVFVNRRFLREQQLNPVKPRHPQGWVSRPIPINESDLFSTWFRLLVIAYASMIIDTPYSKCDWRFLSAPGLGWFRTPVAPG